MWGDVSQVEMAQILSSLPPPQQLPSSSTSQNQVEEILSGQEGVGGDQSLTSPALRLISCSQGPNCRHISREVPGHFQKEAISGECAAAALYPAFHFLGLKSVSSQGTHAVRGKPQGPALSPVSPPTSLVDRYYFEEGWRFLSFFTLHLLPLSCLCLSSLLESRSVCFHSLKSTGAQFPCLGYKA